MRPCSCRASQGALTGQGRDEWGPDGKATPEAKRVDFRKFKGK